jgi:hypothetical protein
MKKAKLKKLVKQLSARVDGLEKRMDAMPLISYTQDPGKASGYSHVIDYMPHTLNPITSSTTTVAGNQENPEDIYYPSLPDYAKTLSDLVGKGRHIEVKVGSLGSDPSVTLFHAPGETADALINHIIKFYEG